MDNFPEGSVVTSALVDAACAYYELTAPDQRDGVAGTLLMWEKGEGELDAYLVDAESRRELFKPLRAAYFTKRGDTAQAENPTYSNVGDYPTVSAKDAAETGTASTT